jgi:hypothetical protein
LDALEDLIDLGSLDGDVLAFGGIVSNAHALSALRHHASAYGFSPARMVCTGDVAAYCGQPAEAVAGMRALGALGAATIRGNCEDSLARNSTDCGCGFEQGSSCDRLSATWYAHADACLGDSERGWMAALPRLAVFRAHGRRWGVVHGGVTAVNRFLWPNSPEAEFAEEIAALWRQLPVRWTRFWPAIAACPSCVRRPGGCGSTPARWGCRPMTAAREPALA